MKFRPAPSVELVADKLIPKFHPHLQDVRVEYVFLCKTPLKGGHEVWGRSRVITGLNAYLATPYYEGGNNAAGTDGAFFVVEIAELVWAGLGDTARTALVDHELSHCVVEYDDDSGDATLATRPHDVEEFHAIIGRYGAWKADLALFNKQLRLWDDKPTLADA